MKRFRNLLLLIPLLLLGCNIFDWTSSPTSATDYLNEGRIKLSEGDYVGALSDFRNAVRESPNSSDARFAYAKARLLVSGINSLDVLSSLSRFDLQGDNITIAFFDVSLWPNPRATDLYSALGDIREMLTPIFYGQTTGSFSPRDVALDYGLSETVFGLMQLRDNNRDLIINASDLDISLLWQNGRFNIVGLMSLYQQNGANSVNALLDDASQFTERLGVILTTIITDSSGFNSGNLRATTDSLRVAMQSYRISDTRDNDNDGLIDEVVLGNPTHEYYLNRNYQIRSRVVSDNYGHDAAGALSDNPIPWTNQWLATLSQAKKDSLRRDLP